MVRSLRGEKEASAEELRDYLQKRTGAPWVGKILSFLAGEVSEDQLVEAASSMDTGQRCQAWFYAGMRRLVEGDREGARTWFKKHKGHGWCGASEHISSAVELVRQE